MTREQARIIVAEKSQIKNLSTKDKQLLIQAISVLANHWSIPQPE